MKDEEWSRLERQVAEDPSDLVAQEKLNGIIERHGSPRDVTYLSRTVQRTTRYGYELQALVHCFGCHKGGVIHAIVSENEFLDHVIQTNTYPNKQALESIMDIKLSRAAFAWKDHHDHKVPRC